MTSAPQAPPEILTLPPPQMSPDALSALLQRHWGLGGGLTPLSSERDLLHRLDAAPGRFTVKLIHPAEPLATTEFQTGALLHLARTAPDLPVQRLIPLRDGRPWLDLPEGRLRVLSWLDGRPMALSPRSPAQAASVGRVLGRLAVALADYDHPAADQHMLWDVAQAPNLAALVPSLPEPLASDARGFLAEFSHRIAPALSPLPRQICHADFNPHNLLVDEADLVNGIIDFGDMLRTARVCDLAVAAAYQVDPAAPLPGLKALVQAYRAEAPLTPEEIAILPDLIRSRMMLTLIIGGWRAALQPDNAPYILRNAPSARSGIAALRAVGRDALVAAFMEAR